MGRMTETEAAIKALAIVMLVDKEKSAKEVEFLNDKAEMFNVTKETVKILVTQVENTPVEDYNRLLKETISVIKGDKLRQRILVILKGLANSDGIMKEEEQQLLDSAIEAFTK